MKKIFYHPLRTSVLTTLFLRRKWTFEAQMKAQKPEAIAAVLSHDYASNFLNFFTELNTDNALPLYSSMNTCSPDVLKKLGKDISIKSITAWMPSLDTPEKQIIHRKL